MTLYTAEMVRAEISAAERAQLLVEFDRSPLLPKRMKRVPRVADMWIAGSWLGRKLHLAGCPEAEAESICFAQGQRSMTGDPYAHAASAFNAWVEGRPEYGGEELAEKIFRETFRVVKVP